MGGHYMKGTFRSLPDLLQALKEAQRFYGEEYRLQFKQAEIKYNEDEEFYELSVYFGN